MIDLDVVRRRAFDAGEPGFQVEHDGHLYSVGTIEVTDGRISAIYCVSNPDKLR